MVSETSILQNDKDKEAKSVTYIFEYQEDIFEKSSSVTWKNEVWKYFPSACGSLICIPFGLMVGWTSPAYPVLLSPDSPVPITFDQSAMIAGFLMIGNSVGTPFSSKVHLGTKYGLIIGVSLMSLGWIVMWLSANIYYLLGSRLLVGLGNGYAVGQLKKYIKEMCSPDVAEGFIKQINLYMFSGIVLIFTYSAFVDLRNMAMISTVISLFIFFLIIFLPCTPKELIKSNNIKDAKKLILLLNPKADVYEEINRLQQDSTVTLKQNGFNSIRKNGDVRRKLLIFGFLVLLQQATGAPTSVVYTSIIFKESQVPYYKEICILYILIYFLSNVFGIYISPKFNKKTVLLVSSILVSISFIFNIGVLYFRVNEYYWSFTSVVIMLFFIFVHTVGLGCIPFTLIGDFFTPDYHLFVTKFFVIVHSITALVITKIFQVLMGQFGLYYGFCLFLCLSTITTVFILFAINVPKKEQPDTKLSTFKVTIQ